MRKAILSRIVDTPVTWLLIVFTAILTSVKIGALSIRDVIKELVVVTTATVVLLFMGGVRMGSRTNKGSEKACKEACKAPSYPFPAPSTQQRSKAPRTFAPIGIEKHTAAAVQESAASRQASRRPVLPPTFASEDFNGQADELAQQLMPTERCQGVVQDIAQDVKKIIVNVLPYADVVGFTNGEVSRGTAYGVAVPEVDIVVNLPPHILVRTLQSQISKLNFSGKVDDRRLHKSGLRMCTDMLVTSGGFKFRRSAFRGRDPKVTLMAPRSLVDAACVPIDFSVNAATPLCNHVLVTACAQVDPRAHMLILLVKRWAKDRGICHAAKGHLMPYAWTLLCIYFLQVGVRGGSILPPFKHLRLALGQDSQDNAGLAQCLQGWRAPAPGSALATKRLGQLFKEFVSFYLEIDWSMEAASIRWGKRSAPSRSLKLNILETPMGSLVGPNIEDPFMPSENMSEMLTANGLTRLWEELTRAKRCFENSAPLSEILTQWVPEEQRAQVDPSDGADIGDAGDASDGDGGPAVEDQVPGGEDGGSTCGDHSETDKGSSTFTPGTAVDSNADPAFTSISSSEASEQSEPPLPPWRKKNAAASGGAPCTADKSSSALPKQHMAPPRPPGLWADKGKPPTSWPTRKTTVAVA